MQATKKRSYPKAKKTLPYKKRATKKSITTKYAAKKKREIKTLDLIFPPAYVRAYVSDTQSGITFNDVGCIQNLARINQGAGIPNRIGNKVALKSLRIRCTVEETGIGGTPPQSARFMIIYDRQANGVYPALDNVLAEIINNNTISPGNHLSSINPNFYDRYIVLCDKIFIIGGAQVGSTISTGPTEQKGFILDEFIKLKGLETQFGSNTAGAPIADLNTGALYVIGWGDQTNGAEPFFMSGTFRLRFYDN
jgi:hypothetical protein